MAKMNIISVAAAALNQTPLDWEGNADHIRQAIESARAEGATILCLPELSITGYGCEDAFASASTIRGASRSVMELLPETEGMIVSLGFPAYYSGAVFDAAALAVDGELVGIHCKQNLAGQGIHYEPRWFKPWPAGVRTEMNFHGMEVPIGDLCFEIDGIRIGFEICEDAWVAQRPGGKLVQRGVDLILNPSASHFAFGKQEIRRRFVLEGSRAFHTAYVYANLLGNEAGRVIYDGGTMIAAGGTMLAEGKRFSYRDALTITAQVDLDLVQLGRIQSSTFLLSESVFCTEKPKHEFSVERQSPRRRHVEQALWEQSGSLKEEEFSRTVALGLYDYMRKSRSGGYVVSLSGGADSSSVATLIWLSVVLGTADIGKKAFLNKLRHLPGLEVARSVEDIMHHLLTCVYQSTSNSSETTRNAARDVAKAAGAAFLEFDVDSLVRRYVEMVSQGIGRTLTWEEDDIALQNIQARVRSPGVWMLANIRGALLLSTSNRSEAAAGYATMDGDTSGGLSPIAGIDKAYLRKWLRWMETEGPLLDGERKNLPALRAVNVQQPTAELRPQDRKQTDEEDLMPYPILDRIEKAAIRDKRSPVEVFHALLADRPEEDPRKIGAWIERFFRLWTRHQWKRERYAPSFHLDDENLDPKTWCRFPILSGGFQREIKEMWEYLDEHFPETTEK